jgi:FkbM family methyltransferase
MHSRLADTARQIQFRGKPRLAQLLVPRVGERLTEVFGASLPLDLRNYIDWMIYTGCYEPLNTHRFRSILQRGMTVVDAGANIGYFSLLSAQIVGPGGRVIAIEPMPANRDVLGRAIAENALTQITLVAEAIGDAPGTGSLHQADQSEFPNRTASMASDASGGQRLEVRIRTLDELLESLGVEHVDLLKIDVDGFEWKVLQGAAQSLKDRKIGNVLIECLPSWLEKSGTSTRSVIDYLARFDLRRRHEPLKSMLLGPVPDLLFTLRKH